MSNWPDYSLEALLFEFQSKAGSSHNILWTWATAEEITTGEAGTGCRPLSVSS